MSRLPAILLLCSISVAVSFGGEQELRTWSYHGRSVEARFVRAVGSTVVLERKDGKRMVVSRRLLSPADKAYLDPDAEAPVLPARRPVLRSSKSVGGSPDLRESRDEGGSRAEAVVMNAVKPPVPCSAQVPPPPSTGPVQSPEQESTAGPPVVSQREPPEVKPDSVYERLREYGRAVAEKARSWLSFDKEDVQGWLKDKVYLGLAAAPLSALLAALFLQVGYRWVVQAPLRYGRAYVACLVGKYMAGGVCYAWTYVPGCRPEIPDSPKVLLLGIPVVLVVISIFLGLFLRNPVGGRIGPIRAFLILICASVILLLIGSLTALLIFLLTLPA